MYLLPCHVRIRILNHDDDLNTVRPTGTKGDRPAGRGSRTARTRYSQAVGAIGPEVAEGAP